MVTQSAFASQDRQVEKLDCGGVTIAAEGS